MTQRSQNPRPTATLESLAESQVLVLERLEKLDQDQQELKHSQQELKQELTQEIRNLEYKFDAFQKGSDGMVRMATTIIITAGAAVIFAPLVRELAPAIAALLKNDAAL